MDGEAGWWTTSGNIGLPPLARAMGVGRQQQHEGHFVVKILFSNTLRDSRTWRRNFIKRKFNHIEKLDYKPMMIFKAGIMHLISVSK